MTTGQYVLLAFVGMLLVGLGLAYLSTVTDVIPAVLFVLSAVIIFGGGYWMQRRGG